MPDGQRCVDDSFLHSGTYPPGEGPCAGPSALARETPYPAGSFRAGTLKITARPSTSGCGQALRSVEVDSYSPKTLKKFKV